MKLCMRKIRQILNCISKKMSNRKIARTVTVSPTTVGKIKRLVEDSSFDISQLNELDDIELKERLGINKEFIPQNKKPQPDWVYVYTELQKRDITLELLWQEYCEAHKEESLSYSRFCALFKEYTNSLAISKRMIHKAGESIQVDFGGRTVEIYQDNKEVLKAQIFVAVLPASGYIFAYAVPSQQIRHWLECHVEMFKFYRGVPNQIITDNLKSAVIKNTKNDLVLNASYKELCEYYDCIIMPARPKKPQDKGLVESCVKVVQNKILAKFRNRKFFSIRELNEAIRPELKELNDSITDSYPNSRYADYIEIDYPALRPLPERDFEICNWRYDVTVNKFYVIKIDDCEYSVPYTYIGQKVDVRHTDNLVEVYFERKCIAIHTKNKASNYSIKQEHMPPEHRMLGELDSDGLLRWAKGVDESVAIVFEENLSNRSGRANAIRRLQAFKRWLIENSDNFDITSGFEYAVCLNIYSIERIKSILKRRTYQRMDTHKASKFVNNHSNIRGSEYFKSSFENAQESSHA
ncbi:IS21 family transposase [Psychrobacter pacificensis]|uniref:IS21 family transposase n=1 Tax=Psychrobacter pacificensis TaxID=112002 RepID=UPI001BAF4A65